VLKLILPLIPLTLAVALHGQGFAHKKFEFTPPDGFVSNGAGGYDRTDLGATIGYQAIPVPYADMLEIFSDPVKIKQQLGDGRIVVSKATVIEKVKGYLIKMEFAAEPDAGYDRYYRFMFARPWAGKTLMMTGAYPVEQDGELYQKYLHAFITVKEKK
jgi:hypothetical protein